jgi:hypothetical protein
MPHESKTAFQLEKMIADITGLDTTGVHIIKVGNGGDFGATFMKGSSAGVSASRAQSDIDAACRQLKLKFKLKA